MLITVLNSHNGKQSVNDHQNLSFNESKDDPYLGEKAGETIVMLKGAGYKGSSIRVGIIKAPLDEVTARVVKALEEGKNDLNLADMCLTKVEADERVEAYTAEQKVLSNAWEKANPVSTFLFNTYVFSGLAPKKHPYKFYLTGGF